MDSPLVTVIIAAYNASKFIAETLDSVFAQTHDNLEVIVVDDGSTDNTADIVKSYSSNITYLYQENSGSCAAPRNKGLVHAKGEFVTFFDADDIMLPDKISTQVKELQACPSAVLCVANYKNFTVHTRSVDHFSTCPILTSYLIKNRDQILTLTPEQCRSILIEENFSIASSPLYRTKYVIEEQGFETSLTACEDFHLIYRVVMHGDAIILPTVGFDRRLHDSNMSSDNQRMLQNLIKSRLALSLLEPAPSLRKRLEKRQTRYRRSLQACLINKGRIIPALKVYRETFPPKSFSDLNHDIRQGVKAILMGITNRLAAKRP